MTSIKWLPSYEPQELRSKTRSPIPTLGASLVCMTLREILSNCGNLLDAYQCSVFGGTRPDIVVRRINRYELLRSSLEDGLGLAQGRAQLARSRRSFFLGRY